MYGPFYKTIDVRCRQLQYGDAEDISGAAEYCRCLLSMCGMTRQAHLKASVELTGVFRDLSVLL